jgi:hypothetical protein
VPLLKLQYSFHTYKIKPDWTAVIFTLLCGSSVKHMYTGQNIESGGQYGKVFYDSVLATFDFQCCLEQSYTFVFFSTTQIL